MAALLPKKLSNGYLVEFLGSFDTVLTDCDGVLWAGDCVIGRANIVINKLRQMGKKVFFVTNNSSKSRDEYVQKFQKLGFQAEKEEIVSSSFVLANFINNLKLDKKTYVIGNPGMYKELDSMGIRYVKAQDEHVDCIFKYARDLKLDPEVGAVAVGFDGNFSFCKVMQAASYLSNPQCHFLATNMDERFPTGQNSVVFPGTGVIVRCVETAAERSAEVMGKPSLNMFQVLMSSHNLDPKRTLMIGDRGNTDILFGKNCGLQTLMVLSGVTDWSEIENWAANGNAEQKNCIADYYLNELGDLDDLF